MDLSKCIMTRVSHDLAGTSGALHNTVELIQMDPSFMSEATPLLAQSTQVLMARLKFFRALFGLENAPVSTLLATHYLKTLSAPVTLKGTVEDRFFLGAVFVCADALIRGGQLTVTQKSITAAGQIHLDDDSQKILTGDNGSLTPKSVGAAWLRRYAIDNGFAFHIQMKDDKLIIELD